MGLVPLNIEQWLVIILGTLSIIPTIVLFIQYRKTLIVDFLLFSGVFLSVTIAAFSQIVADATDILLFFQLHWWSLAFTSLLFFLHASRILWTRTPSVILFIGISWFVILIVLISLWEIMPQEETAFVLFTEMPAVPSSYHPKGAGFAVSGGVILFSSSYTILWILYLICTTLLLIFAYKIVNPPYPSQRIVLTKRMWLVVWILVLGFAIFEIPWILDYFDFITVALSYFLIVLAEMISALIAIFIPESMLISHAQLLRAHKLYEKLQQLKSKEEIAQFGMESLVKYLKSIPEEQMQEIYPDTIT
ncbi:MAG: hypothetical protein JSV04_10790 [Candidatus Heimdallarchaeota archaeon]|nr:MAG: hypothetical protein JSV04_10790 [Candidatus Heimdallarchaeota archaeon]